MKSNILDKLKLEQALKLAKKKEKCSAPKEAEDIYRDILTKFPMNKRAAVGLKSLAARTADEVSKVQGPTQGQIKSVIELHHQRQHHHAIELVESLILEFPRAALLYNVKGAVLKDLGQFGASVEAYTKALNIEPNYAEAYNNMGVSLQKQGKLEEAIDAFNKALTIKSDYADVHNNMGNNYKERGMLLEAIEAYSKALDIKPDHATALENCQNLAVQLLPLIENYICGVQSRIARVSCEIMLRPKYQIQNAIKAYLEADLIQAAESNNKFKACSPKIWEKLKPRDMVIYKAYSDFIGKLLIDDWVEVPHPEASVYHLGESHSLSYAHRNVAIDGSYFRITPRMTFGAKAFHFSRSKHDLFKAITSAHFLSLPKNSKVFLSYGEIDCRPDEGFISAATKLNTPLEELIDQTARGYVQWFLDQNKDLKHHIYFINVPAPVFKENLTTDINLEVARSVNLFNAALKKYSQQHRFDLVDVFQFTVGSEGFSNGLYHIDGHHLGAKAIPQIEQQLS